MTYSHEIIQDGNVEGDEVRGGSRSGPTADIPESEGEVGTIHYA